MTLTGGGRWGAQDCAIESRVDPEYGMQTCGSQPLLRVSLITGCSRTRETDSNKAPAIRRSESCGETLRDTSVVSLSHPIRLLGLQASKVQVWQQGTLYSFRLEEDLQGVPSASSQKV